MRRSPCPPPRRLPAEVLDTLAVHLAVAHHDTPTAPLAVRVRDVGGETVDIATTPLPHGEHPVDALVGQTVPAPWQASGLVASGVARALPDLARPRAGARTGAATPASRVTFALLVDRRGQVAHHVEGIATGAEPPEGRVLDVLRRTLGLPTSPPAVPAATWWRTLWLDGVVSAAAFAPAAAHPATTLVGALGRPLVEAIVADPSLVGLEGWATLSALAASPQAPADPGRAALRAAALRCTTVEAAAWMDDGCFARWLLAALPPVEELLALADSLLPPGAASEVRAAMGAPGAEP